MMKSILKMTAIAGTISALVACGGSNPTPGHKATPTPTASAPVGVDPQVALTRAWTIDCHAKSVPSADYLKTPTLDGIVIENRTSVDMATVKQWAAGLQWTDALEQWANQNNDSGLLLSGCIGDAQIYRADASTIARAQSMGQGMHSVYDRPVVTKMTLVTADGGGYAFVVQLHGPAGLSINGPQGRTDQQGYLRSVAYTLAVFGEYRDEPIGKVFVPRAVAFCNNGECN